MPARSARPILIAVLLALLCLPGGPLFAQQATPDSATPGSQPRDPEAEGELVPVLIGGDPVIYVTTGIGPYTAQLRADRISQRLLDIIHDRSVPNPSVTVVERDNSSEVRAGSHLLMVVTERDAGSLGIDRAVMAAQYAREFEAAIRAERLRYAPGTLARSGMFGLLATFGLAVVLWLIYRLVRLVQRWADHWRVQRYTALRVQQAELVSADQVGRVLDRTLRAVRVVLIVLAFDLYLTYVLGLFPWTRAVSSQLLGYLITPLSVAANSVVGYLPNLLFVLVIAALVNWVMRLVGLFFHQIEDGRITFADFPAEWAATTSKIVKVLLFAFGVVVAFPYLPASNSPAFAGVSVFMGILVSLASSSALSNMIAGIVLTYTSAFRLGDRVKLGDSFGDIIETSLLATRVRTIKNEEITIPNSVVLGTSVINYTRECRTRGLILHTSVTIGYDAPWRKVHDLLMEAALATKGVLTEPRPFAWQTALNDFYVTYEINAYTDEPHNMADIYAELHSRIQDAFYAAGVEIMSPHYTSLRDGNTVAIPAPFRPPGYRAPAFHVEGPTREG